MFKRCFLKPAACAVQDQFHAKLYHSSTCGIFASATEVRKLIMDEVKSYLNYCLFSFKRKETDRIHPIEVSFHRWGVMQCL